MRIFISGGGDAKQSRKLDKSFVEQLGPGDRILYIPIAMPIKEHSYEECFDWLESTLKRYKFDKIDMWTELGGKRLKDLEKYKAVYIGGGNTFYLLDRIKKTGFSRLLKNYIKKGGIVYGGSAGAIILGREIGTARIGNKADKNKVGLKNLTGIDCLGGVVVKCHYSKKNDEEIFRYANREKTQVIALPEETGACFTSKNRGQVIGDKDAYFFFNAKKKVLKRGKHFRIKREDLRFE